MLMNPLADTLVAGKLGLALIVNHVHSVDIAIAARTCGYEAVYIDLEHSVIPEAAAAQICVTALHVGLTPLVRVASHDAHLITRVLDAGSLGVVAPHVESAEEAQSIVAATKFAPLGSRSAAGQWPHLGFENGSSAESRRTLNAKSMVIVILESAGAIERAAEIAAVPGVDVLHVGSTDLCESIGFPGQFGHVELEQSFKRVIQACRDHGKVAGAGGLGTAPDITRKVIDMGVRFVTAGSEWGFMMEAARERARVLRSPQA
jgi:2-keto-3-deoxy-L-rhamnonate aldolase RhmA